MVILAVNLASQTDKSSPLSAEDAMTLIGDLAEDLAATLSEVADLNAELAKARRTGDELKVAVDTNRRIGAAMGILMGRHRITERQSFDLLKDASQASHRKLRDIALDVIETGMLVQPGHRPGIPPMEATPYADSSDR